jgi:hypothetical protein
MASHKNYLFNAEARVFLNGTSPFISFRINSSQLKAFSWLSESANSGATRFREGIPERRSRLDNALKI